MFRANFWLVDFGFCWVCGFGLVSSLFSVGFGGLAFGFWTLGFWYFGQSRDDCWLRVRFCDFGFWVCSGIVNFGPLGFGV